MIGDDRHEAWLHRKEQERLDEPASIDVQMASNKDFHTFMAEHYDEKGYLKEQNNG